MAERSSRERPRASRRRSSGGVRIPVGSGFAGRIAANREAVRITDLDHAEIVNPLLAEKGLKSLLGVPLIVEGAVIGVLHVGSLEERDFTDDDVELLQSAGDRAALAVQGRLAERERGLAEALQRSLMPRLPDVPGMGIEGRYLPSAARLGGDWYDAFTVPGGRLGMAIGDVSGRGFHAAALMGQLRSGLRAYAMEGGSPAEVVGRLSQLLRQLEPGRNATLLYLLLDPQEGSLLLAGAGHPPPLVLNGDGAGSFVELRGSVPLGAVRYASYEEVETRLEPGATLVLYTDGVIERPGEPLDAGLERLLEAAARADRESVGDLRRDRRGPAAGRRDPRRRGAPRGAGVAALRTRSSCGFPRMWTRSRRSAGCSAAGWARPKRRAPRWRRSRLRAQRPARMPSSTRTHPARPRSR